MKTLTLLLTWIAPAADIGSGDEAGPEEDFQFGALSFDPRGEAGSGVVAIHPEFAQPGEVREPGASRAIAPARSGVLAGCTAAPSTRRERVRLSCALRVRARSWVLSLPSSPLRLH